MMKDYQALTYSSECKRTINSERKMMTHYLNRGIATLLLVALSPIVCINAIVALFTDQQLFTLIKRRDALGRFVMLHHFKHGLWQRSALLIDVVSGRLSFCGVHFSDTMALSTQQQLRRTYHSNPGIFSLYALHQASGLVDGNEEDLLRQQLAASPLTCIAIVCKSLLCSALYGRSKHRLCEHQEMPKRVELFGLTINNTTVDDVAAWAMRPSSVVWPNVGFFINVNSINIACQSSKFKRQLQQGATLFADGSGMRIAARHAGYQLKENINGTDLLPVLCQRCAEQQQSIFLFGAKAGVAQKAAHNLQAQHHGLTIAGTHHGYINEEQSKALIEQINQSDCDVLLVALGSPIQESWVLANRHALRCRSILAVGGLFDFYSGDIARAPLSFRQLGLEWVWRLVQEPKTKFHRYIVGNPLFLIRVYILGLATKGEQ